MGRESGASGAVPSSRPRGPALRWLWGQALLLVICLPFLWHALWTQVYFEPTDEALTQSSAHRPELVAALLAGLAAIIGVFVRGHVKVPAGGH